MTKKIHLGFDLRLIESGFSQDDTRVYVEWENGEVRISGTSADWAGHKVVREYDTQEQAESLAWDIARNPAAEFSRMGYDCAEWFKPATEMGANTIASHYLTAAAWTDSEELDGASWSIAARADAMADAVKFIELAGDALAALPESYGGDAAIGHDLWLTRNGHGTGFWDRDLGELGDKLARIAEGLGTKDAYVGDDGMVYFS